MATTATKPVQSPDTLWTFEGLRCLNLNLEPNNVNHISPGEFLVSPHMRYLDAGNSNKMTYYLELNEDYQARTKER